MALTCETLRFENVCVNGVEITNHSQPGLFDQLSCLPVLLEVLWLCDERKRHDEEYVNLCGDVIWRCVV